MKHPGLGVGLVATTLFASACNGAGTSGTGVSSPGGLAGAAPGEPRQTCNADAVQWAVGQTASEEIVERARRESGADIVRVLPPGIAVTQEFRYGRLNLNVDRLNVITSASCW